MWVLIFAAVVVGLQCVLSGGFSSLLCHPETQFFAFVTVKSVQVDDRRLNIRVEAGHHTGSSFVVPAFYFPLQLSINQIFFLSLCLFLFLCCRSNSVWDCVMDRFDVQTLWDRRACLSDDVDELYHQRALSPARPTRQNSTTPH